MSKAIKELEKSLGQILFERSRQGMVPTAAGLRVARHARLLVNELRHLTDETSVSSGVSGSLLRIGMPPYVAEHFAPAILRRVRELSNGAVAGIQLHEGRLQSLIEQLLRGEIDALLSLYSPRAVDAMDLSMLDIRTVANVPMVVVAAPELGIARTRKRWAHLAIQPWILPPHNTHQRRSLDGMFTSSGSRAPIPMVETSSLSACVQLAAEGLGLAAVPLGAAQAAIDSGRLTVVDVRPSMPETVIALMMRKVSAIYLDSLRVLDAAVVSRSDS